MVEQPDITLDDIMGRIIALQNSVDEGFRRVAESFKRVDDELQASRNIIDDELVGLKDMISLEQRVANLEADVKRLARLKG